MKLKWDEDAWNDYMSGHDGVKFDLAVNELSR